MDWTWGYDLPLTVAVMVPFWFLFTTLMGRVSYGMTWREVLPFAVWASIVCTACVWFLLALPKMLF